MRYEATAPHVLLQFGQCGLFQGRMDVAGLAQIDEDVPDALRLGIDHQVVAVAGDPSSEQRNRLGGIALDDESALNGSPTRLTRGTGRRRTGQCGQQEASR